MANYLLAVASDLHCNSTVAVCPPSIDLDDGGHYKASPAQTWLWGHWLEKWEAVARLRDKHKAELIGAFNGDVTEGWHHGSTQVISNNPTIQSAVVDAVMQVPIGLHPDSLFFIRGTEAHVGKSASYEESLARSLRISGLPVQGDPDTSTASWWQCKMELNGRLFDLAHHGRMGQRPWTRMNITMNLAAEIFYEHASNGERHPDIAIRSHLHKFGDTGSAHPTRVIQTPAWQLRTAFTYRVPIENLADIGMVVFLVDEDGVVTVMPMLEKPSRGTVWRP